LWNLSQHNKDRELEQIGSKRYRIIVRDSNEVKWWEQQEGEDDIQGIRLPFDLENYCTFSNPFVGVVAGATNAGKTAFFVKTVQLNYVAWGDKIHFFCREGFSDLKAKFTYLGIPIPPKFHTYRRFDHFQDVIVPDGFNIVDYLKVDTNAMYTVEKDIEAILKRLKSGGIALIGMQKPPGRDTAYGGEFTRMDPTFYISLDKFGYRQVKVKFVKVKKPKGNIDIYERYFEAKIVGNGSDFTDIHTGTEGDK